MSFNWWKNSTKHFFCLMLTAVMLTGLAACGGGGGSTSTTASSATLSGAVIDGKVSGATLTLYSDQAMTTEVGSGTTDSQGAFDVTLTVTTAPDPIYIKSTGGIDIDTGLAAPTMLFVGNTTGANGLSSFNITPLTDDVFDRVSKGDSLSAAQGNARTAFGLSSNTGTNGLYEDPSSSANTGLKTAAFKKLTAGTIGGTISAGDYKMFVISIDESAVGTQTLSSIADLVNPSNGMYIEASIRVDANGDISSLTTGQYFKGKISGSSMLFDIVDNLTNPNNITRIVGNIGLNGSVAGNFTDVDLTTTPVGVTKGVWVGSLIPTTGIDTTGLNSFVNDFYTPGSSTGLMNVVARDIFNSGATPPRVSWGQVAVTAVDTSAGTATMSAMTLRTDAGSVAASSGLSSSLPFLAGKYIKSSDSIPVPTNLLVFEFDAGGGGDKTYVATAVGLRRGIYFYVPNATGKVESVGESYLSKVDSLAPSGFTAGATHDVTTANIHPGMPGNPRSNALSEGLTPSDIGAPMVIPGSVTVGNGYWDPNSTSAAPELMVFQGSMFIMKKDDSDDFATNQMVSGGADDHIRVVEFFESGAMQGEEIMGGTVPGASSLQMRNFPSTFIGFVHNQADTTTPSFSGRLNFLARVQYASDYSSFANAYTSGSLTITAPSGSSSGSATLVATPGGGTTATSTLTVDVPPSGTYGVYQIHGALTGGGYIDIVWPIGGTKALYAISDQADGTGTITEIGEAYMTQ